jgi:hypothetical protein
MHALPSHPRNPLVAGLLALALAVLIMLVAATELDTLDFSIGGSGDPVTPSSEAGLSVTPQPAEPTWVSDPLAAPLSELAVR